MLGFVYGCHEIAPLHDNTCSACDKQSEPSPLHVTSAASERPFGALGVSFNGVSVYTRATNSRPRTSVGRLSSRASFYRYRVRESVPARGSMFAGMAAAI